MMRSLRKQNHSCRRIVEDKEEKIHLSIFHLSFVGKKEMPDFTDG